MKTEWVVKVTTVVGETYSTGARYADRAWAEGIAALINRDGWHAGRRASVALAWVEQYR